MTSKRLEILKSSLIKKEAELDRRFKVHFASVKEANGQPLNDKRNGAATMKRWEKQNESIRNQKASIEKTKRAIEIEEGKIRGTKHAYDKLPKPIADLVDSGKLVQWRKHPNMFFVKGVEKARIVWRPKDGIVAHRYLGEVKDKEKFDIFKDCYNGLYRLMSQ